MAGRRVYGGSKMEIFLENEGIPTEAMDALLASGPSTTGFHGSRTMVSFERVHENMQKIPFFCPPELEETGDEDLDECFQQPEKKRRLTCNQVRFLEKTFEHENKLEPDKKLQLAKDLGLQPRQVAIWFQNRRARWKTKQLEKDYDSLKSSYNALKADYENLFKEKEKLKAEVNILTDKLLLEGKSISEPFEVPIAESDWVSKEKGTADPMMVRKSEDLSSANSAVSESNSSQCTNRAQTSLHELAESSNAFETDQSDFSQGRDGGGAKGCDFLKLEDNPCNYGFSVEDQAFWFWPY